MAASIGRHKHKRAKARDLAAITEPKRATSHGELVVRVDIRTHITLGAKADAPEIRARATRTRMLTVAVVGRTQQSDRRGWSSRCVCNGSGLELDHARRQKQDDCMLQIHGSKPSKVG